MSAAELLLRQRLAAVVRGLVGARAGDVASIHQARVATRRLRESLPLLASGAWGRKLQRVVRQLTRTLGPVRELDVALESLGEFQRSGDASRAAVLLLRHIISAERQALHAEAVRAIDRADFPRLRHKALEALEAHKGQAVTSSQASRRAAAQRRAARRAEGVRAAVDNAAGIYLPDRLHEVRIAVKKLRYAIEIVRHVGGARANRASSTSSLRSAPGQLAVLKRAQELLGRMHDLEILIAKTRAVQASPQAPSLRLSGDLDRLVRSLETECRLLHGRYMSSRAQLLEICARVEARAAKAA
jgi:CHAD domain-containing protein